MGWFSIMNGCFAPLKGGGVDVVDLDETIDGVSHLVRRSEAYAFQRSATLDAEPAFNLVDARVSIFLNKIKRCA